MTLPSAPAPDLAPLWEPIRLGSVTVPNRIYVSSHNTAHEEAQLAAYLARRAAGGPGLVVMGGVPVHPSTMSNPTLVPAWQPDSVPRLAAIATQVKEAGRPHGGLFFGQVFHGGPNDTGNAVVAHHHVAIAPSAVAAPPSGRIPKVADQDDIDAVVAGFGDTAHHLQLAGFDGVEVSGSHGYLVHAFLSSTMNRRTDGYGGSPERRARFALEVARAIRDRCGPDFPVLLRLGLDERLGPGGMTAESSRDLLAVLGDSGLFDGFGISGGVYATLDETVAPASAERDTVFLESALVAREVLGPDVPLMLAGSIMSVERAAELVASGAADLVAMTRSQSADPDLVRKAREGRLDEVRHCIRGNQGCWRGIKTRAGVTCTVNPSAGREAQLGPVQPTDEPRCVVVVGGGPAGLRAAVVAAERGHRVTLLERADRLGGQVRYAAALPGRASWLLAADDLERAARRLGVEVRLGVDADAGTVLALDPSVVVVATGARWHTDGWSYHQPQRAAPVVEPDALVVDPLQAMDAPESLGRRVVLVDDTGGYAPLGLAELLSSRGIEVTVTSPRAALGDHTVLTGEASFVVPRLLAARVTLRTLTAVQSVSRSEVTVEHVVTGAVEHLAADAVVTFLLRTPVDDESGLSAALRDAEVEHHRIGDAVAARDVDDALYEAENVARAL